MSKEQMRYLQGIIGIVVMAIFVIATLFIYPTAEEQPSDGIRVIDCGHPDWKSYCEEIGFDTNQ